MPHALAPGWKDGLLDLLESDIPEQALALDTTEGHAQTGGVEVEPPESNHPMSVAADETASLRDNVTPPRYSGVIHALGAVVSQLGNGSQQQSEQDEFAVAHDAPEVRDVDPHIVLGSSKPAFGFSDANSRPFFQANFLPSDNGLRPDSPESEKKSRGLRPSDENGAETSGPFARPLDISNRVSDTPLRDRVAQYHQLHSPRFMDSSLPRGEEKPDLLFSTKDNTHGDNFELSAWALAAEMEQLAEKRDGAKSEQYGIYFSKWKGEEVMVALDESQRLFDTSFGQTEQKVHRYFGSTFSDTRVYGDSKHFNSLSSELFADSNARTAVLRQDVALLRASIAEEAAAQRHRFRSQTEQELRQSLLLTIQAAAYTPDVVKPVSVQHNSLSDSSFSLAVSDLDESHSHSLRGHSGTPAEGGAQGNNIQNPLLSRMLFDQEQHHQTEVGQSDSDDDSEAYWSAEDQSDDEFFQEPTRVGFIDVNETDTLFASPDVDAISSSAESTDRGDNKGTFGRVQQWLWG